MGEIHRYSQHATAPEHYRFSDDLADWAHIYQPTLSLAVCTRSPAAAVVEFSRQAARQVIDLSLRLTDSAQLAAHFERGSLAALPGYGEWLADVGTWVEAFQCLFDLDHVGLRLRTLDKAMCPRFHVDQVPVRLVTTYGDCGTQWLANTDVDRAQLGVRSSPCSDRETGLYIDDNAIRQLPAFSVALLKGEAWSCNEGRGLVHRSPAPAPSGRRLLLTLDLLP